MAAGSEVWAARRSAPCGGTIGFLDLGQFSLAGLHQAAVAATTTAAGHGICHRSLIVADVDLVARSEGFTCLNDLLAHKKQQNEQDDAD